MKKIAFVLFLALLVAAAGCKDITGTFKPGSFGKTPREKAMVEALKGKYGDLTQKGEPRFLEARMTSKVEDFIPVDTVSQYSQDTQKLYVWFVYDNYNKDQIEVEWIYVDEDYSIHTFTEQSGEDFGRGAFILEMPDDGWALGNYKVVIRGQGLVETLTFQIIAGATVATPLPFENGEITLSPNPGWYLTRWEYYMHPNDYSLVGAMRKMVAGKIDPVWDYQEGIGDKNNFTNVYTRKYDNGDVVATGSATTTWTDPPAYFGGGERPIIEVTRVSESSWGINPLNITFDEETVGSGGATMGAIEFITSNGETHVQNYQGTFQLKKPLPGKVGHKKAVIIHLSGYGFKYYYEWKE